MNMNKTLKELFNPIRANEELKDHTLAFLAEKTQAYTEVKPAKPQKRTYHFYAAACACLLFMICGCRWLYFTPTATISIDINPSIEMDINRFDQVISINDFNEDGRELAGMLHVKYKNYADAVEQILNNDTIAALLSDNEVLTITVAGPDGRQSAEILSGVEACTAHHSNTHCYTASPKEAAAAHEAGLSCGKYRAFLELQLLNPDMTPEAVQGMTMKDILALIDSLSEGSDSDIGLYHAPESGHHDRGCGHGDVCHD